MSPNSPINIYSCKGGSLNLPPLTLERRPIMKTLAPFTINNVLQKINSINFEVCLSHYNPFPKNPSRMLSYYYHKPRFIEIYPNGSVQGGYSRMITSLIDFSFIRSLVADAYSKEGGNCHDPVSLYLLELFRWLDKHPSMKDFLENLRDKDKGRAYRTYACIDEEHIPCDADFSNLKSRLGEKRYLAIFHTLIEIVEKLGMLTYSILSHDGSLFPTYARYKGCHCFSKECREITFPDLIKKVKEKILYRLKDPSRIKPGKEIRITLPCPNPNFPEEKAKRPNVEVLVFTLFIGHMENKTKDQTLKLLGLEEEFSNLALTFKPLRSNIQKVLESNTFTFCCPKLPKDLEARIGVRRSKSNPNKKEKIFGYDAIITTSIELQLGIELPVACITIPGNPEEGSQLIKLKAQVKRSHPKAKTKIDLADSKFDNIENYNHLRKEGSIPIIDYNPRNENLEPHHLKERGYDQNGYPIAPCGISCFPNGYDEKNQRIAFSCLKMCQKIPTLRQTYCPHLQNDHGLSTHIPIQRNPRLYSEVPRGTARRGKIKALRSASERTNSTIQEDLGILKRPRLRGLQRASILSLLATTATLITRVCNFIVRVTNNFRKFFASGKKDLELILTTKIPKFLANLVFRE